MLSARSRNALVGRSVVVARSPFAVDVRDASAYVSVGELITILASAEQTAGAFGLMESVFARGVGASTPCSPSGGRIVLRPRGRSHRARRRRHVQRCPGDLSS